MDEERSIARAFAGATFQTAGADFLASFSELLRAASLIERRPSVRADNPDIGDALERARWFLVGAIEALARYGAACGDLPGGTATGDELVGGAEPGWDRGAFVPSIIEDLFACLKALERLDAQSPVSAPHLHVAVAAYTKALINGQHAAQRDYVA